MPDFIQKLYYGSTVNETCEEHSILEFKISAMTITNEHVLIGHENGQLQLIDPDTAHTMRQMNGHTRQIICIVYCPELSRVITGSLDITARVWNVETGKCVHVLNGYAFGVWCAAVHGTTYVYCTKWALLKFHASAPPQL